MEQHHLDQLSKSAIDRAADFGILVKVNGSHGALCHAFFGELEFLKASSISETVASRKPSHHVKIRTL